MPLTPFQKKLLAELAASEGTQERYLAGGAALHFLPNSARFSEDLGFFHDTVAKVARAFGEGRSILENAGYQVDVGRSIPGFIRAIVRRGEEIRRLTLAEPFDLQAAKEEWLEALASADAFVRERPPEEMGCLYFSAAMDGFTPPRSGVSLEIQGLVPHFGAPGGVVPRVVEPGDRDELKGRDEEQREGRREEGPS